MISARFPRRSEAAPCRSREEECHISDKFCATLWSDLAEANYLEREVKTEINVQDLFKSEVWDLVYQILSAQRSRTIFDVCERPVLALGRCYSYHPG